MGPMLGKVMQGYTMPCYARLGEARLDEALLDSVMLSQARLRQTFYFIAKILQNSVITLGARINEIFTTLAPEC
jgi:hypothetical protein